MESNQTPTPSITEDRPVNASLGLKLTLAAVGLMLFGFMVYSIITIRISQGNLEKNLEEELNKETADTILHIQTSLEQVRVTTVNLAIAVETGDYDEKELADLLENSLLRNTYIDGVAIGFEPNQLEPNTLAWAQRYRRTSENEVGSERLTDYFNQEWYLRPKSTLSPAISNPYQDTEINNEWIVTISAPFYDESGAFKGVVSTDITMAVIQSFFIDQRIENTGYAYLLDENGTILGMGKQGQAYAPMVDSMYAYAQSAPNDSWADLTRNMTAGQSGFQQATDWEGNPMYVAYAPLGMDTGWSLGLVFPVEASLQKTRELQTALTGYSLLLALVFGFVIYYLSKNITNPLIKLTEAAEEILKGNLQSVSLVDTNDEVGMLSDTFNRMTGQLRDTLSNLERRIEQRTLDLEFSRRQTEMRAAQYLAIGEISKLINSEQKLGVLLPLIARLVSERFDCYHVGIFIIDSTRQYAVLQASNSVGGQAMLERGFKIKIGEGGIVGLVAQTGVPRISPNTGADALSPELPETRSEAAIPLRTRDSILGILDVQSDKPGFFTDEDINMFGILADQVAIAIDNTRLFEQTQQALFEARLVYQQSLQEGWKELTREENSIGYYQTLTGGRPLTKPVSANEIDQAMFRGETLLFHADGKTNEPVIVVPIKLREQIIGVMHIKAPLRERQWMQSEIDLAESVSERLSLALENARLIQETRRQVIKEQTIGEITGKISSSVDLYNVLATAVEQLGRTMPGSEVTIKLKGDADHNGE